MKLPELRRASAQLSVLLLLLLGIGLLDLGVSATLGYDHFGGQRQTFSRIEQASAKALALAAAQRRGVSVGLVLGMSTADWGIDLSRLDQASPGLHWAKVTGEYSSFTNLLEVVRRFRGTGLRPQRTLLCVHYGMLLGTRRHEATRLERLREFRERLPPPGETAGLGRIFTLSWLGNNRARAANDFELRLGALREKLLLAFSQPMSTIYPLKDDPFADTQNAHVKPTPQVRRRHVQAFQERWQTAQAARDDEATAGEARALTSLIEQLSSSGRLVVVLMPEHSEFRAVAPQALARRLLDQAILRAHVSEQPSFVDLRDQLPDEYFIDEVHASRAGRPRLTEALLDALPP